MNFITFATGLSYSIGMASLAGGSLVVGTTNRPALITADFEKFFHGAGKVMKFTDANNDGIADGPPQVVFATTGAVTGVATAGDFLVVSTTGAGSVATANRKDLIILAPSGGGNYASLGSLRLDMPNLYNSMTVASSPADGGTYFVYFHVAACTPEAMPGPDVNVSGPAHCNLARGIYLSDYPPCNLSKNLGGMNVAANGDLFFTDNTS